MATCGRSIEDVRSDLKKISQSTSEGNLKGQPGSKIWKGGKGPVGGGKKGGGSKKDMY